MRDPLLAEHDERDERVSALRGHHADAIDVDLSSVTFADADAVACLLRCRQLAAEAGQELTVVRPSRSAALVISVTRTAEPLGMVAVA